MTNILLAGDNPWMLSVLEEALSAVGYEVVLVDASAEGLQLLRTVLPGAIMVDLDARPGSLSGLTMLRTLRADPSVGRTIPIIVLAECAEDIPGNTLPVAAQIVEKPFDINEVLGVLHAPALATLDSGHNAA